jgi:DNA-binding NarL/FixJ family response regulator
MKSSVILVGIVEDNYDYAQTIASCLQCSSDISVAGIWQDAEAALAELPAVRPDVVLTDIQLPGVSGIECIRRMSFEVPEMKFLVLSMCEDDKNIFEALQAGASGYLLKGEDCDTIVRHVRDLVTGDTPVSQPIIKKMIRYFNRQTSVASCSVQLTKREEEIVTLLAEGKMYKEVSLMLGIAMETTKKHIRNIYDKLDVQNRTEAVNKWRSYRFREEWYPLRVGA